MKLLYLLLRLSINQNEMWIKEEFLIECNEEKLEADLHQGQWLHEDQQECLILMIMLNRKSQGLKKVWLEGKQPLLENDQAIKTLQKDQLL